MKKAVVFGVVVLLLVGVGGVGFYLTQNIDGIVKDLIEEIGTDVTKSDVKVASVKLSLVDGAGVINGITIANPPGFSQGSIIQMDTVSFAIDTASLTEDVYVIKHITIDGAKVLAEQSGTSLNVQEMMTAMEEEDASGTSGADGSSDDDILLALEVLNFTNGSVHLKSSLLGEKTLELPDITLKDLGRTDKGLTPDELGSEIGTELFGELTVAVKDIVKDLARELAAEKLKEKISAGAAEGLDKLKSLFNRGD